MVDRWGKTELRVSDVKPRQLRQSNRDALLDRLREYRQFYHSVNNSYLDHPVSRVGSFTILVHRINDAGSDVDVRRAWTAVETWAAAHNVTVT